MSATDLDDLKLADEKVAELYVADFPPAIRIAIGTPMRQVIVDVIRRERMRCMALLVEGAQLHKRKQVEAESGLQLTGDPRAIQAIGLRRAEAVGGVAALTMAADIIQMEPGSCNQCGGGGLVPSSIVGSGGQRMAIQCPVCGGDGKAREQPAPAAPPQNGVTT